MVVETIKNSLTQNPSIYEINTRVFIKRFDSQAKLKNVPREYWQRLKKIGIDYIWLMGIWSTCHSSIEKYCFTEDLIMNYNTALKDWRKEDVIGSPFAIDCYQINSTIGSKQDLLELKSFLNEIGLALILDFVPNHFNAETQLIKSHPQIFLRVDRQTYLKDNHTYFQPEINEEKYFAHGRDPFFTAWQDTVQVNFFSKDARNYLIDVLKNLTSLCDGVRCDMAMLALNNVFRNTWSGALNHTEEVIETEFWHEAISQLKKIRKDFLFIAESYWDLEWYLQQLGFDFTYDKSLTDRIKNGNANSIRDHLLAEQSYQQKSLRFIENHDEERAIAALGKERARAAAIIISTIQGMRFYYDGQFEGRKIKLPVQLGREPNEIVNHELLVFYEKLFSIINNEVFKNGDWSLLETISSWEGNNSFKNILAWQWSYKSERRIVVVNYSEITSTCRIKLDVRNYPEEFELIDLLNNQKYLRSAEEVYHIGLYIELKPWQAHIFSL